MLSRNDRLKANARRALLASTLALTTLGMLAVGAQAWAVKPESEGSAPKSTMQQPAASATLEPQTEENIKAAQSQLDQQKLQVAKDLTDWVNHTLQEKKALVAVVAREGSEATKKQDKTGMGHAGLAVYDPRAQSWIVYNLLNDTQGGKPQGSIWRTAPLDFFYAQKGYERDALLLIPDAETQRRVYEAILDGKYKSLHFTRDYNLVSAYNTARSLNCNKWLLLNIVAARTNNYNPQEVLATISTGYEPGVIKLNPIERQFAKGKATILADELPAFGPIKTVTVESLYRSSLFDEKLFYSGRKL